MVLVGVHREVEQEGRSAPLKGGPCRSIVGEYHNFRSVPGPNSGGAVPQAAFLDPPCGLRHRRPDHPFGSDAGGLAACVPPRRFVPLRVDGIDRVRPCFLAGVARTCGTKMYCETGHRLHNRFIWLSSPLGCDKVGGQPSRLRSLPPSVGRPPGVA
jgi:hypothetical protein